MSQKKNVDEFVEEETTVSQSPEHTAAANMDTEFIVVAPEMTVKEAVVKIREHDLEYKLNSNHNPYIYVVEQYGNLVGVLSFQTLALARGNSLIENIMIESDRIKTVDVDDDQEMAVQVLTEHKLLSVPVLNAGKIVGILTADDIIDIIDEEFDEDISKQSAQQALNKPYLQTKSTELWRKRVGWLLLLFIAEFFTSTILKGFEDELEACISLVYFVPLLVSAGGNSAAQITGTLIRVMETEGVSLRHGMRVLRKEIATSSMLGLVMGIAGVIRAWTLGVEIPVMLTVGTSVICIVVWASVIGSILPLVLKKLKIDPAIVSSALMATLIDATGLMIFLMYAKLFVFSGLF